MAYLLRLELPDVPGALGAVATELGKAGADILAMDIVERSADRAVDDIVVALPHGRAPDLLITAAESVPGVRVESVRPDPGVAASHREWELVEALAADPAEAAATLAELVPEVLRVGWAAVFRMRSDGEPRVVATGGGAPDMTGLAPPLAGLTGPSRLDTGADWVPQDWRLVDTSLAVAPLGDDGAVLVGRPGGPAIRDIEVSRLAHLAGLAAVVRSRPAVSEDHV